jgi:hypothetical protein
MTASSMSSNRQHGRLRPFKAKHFGKDSDASKGHGVSPGGRDQSKPEGYVFGRPTLYRPEYCQQVIEVMSEGLDLAGFAGTISVSIDAVYDWMARWPDFYQAVKVARTKRLLFLQRKLLNTKQGVGVTAAIFALKNADPETWQDRYNVQTQTTVRIEHVSDEQLLEIATGAKPMIEAQPLKAMIVVTETDVSEPD